jgi:uncharacterized protein
MGARLTVRLTPRAARDQVDGFDERGGETLILARVRAVPEKGKANAALEQLIAEALGLPKSTVKVVGGGKSRLKTVEIDSHEPSASLRERLALHITKG